jgi:hypothetical protein
MSWLCVPKSSVDVSAKVKDLEVTVRSVAHDTVTAVSSEVEKNLPAVVAEVEKNLPAVVAEVEKSFASALDSSVNKKCLPAGFSLFGFLSPLKNYLYNRVPVLSSIPPPETVLASVVVPEAVVKSVSEVASVPDVLLGQASSTVASSEEPQQNPGQLDPSK